MKRIKIICVDFQNDFTSKGGDCYRPRKSVSFVNNIIVPYFRKKKIKVAEIVSDYRTPRPGDERDLCHPDEWGYESGIPSDIKLSNVWVKCMNSPIWTRKNIGVAGKKPGLPFQDPKLFGKWLEKTIGTPKSVDEVILMGLTVDCCVFCTAQELRWRGYNVRILEEGVDTASGSLKEKKHILNNAPLANWAKPISWKELKKQLEC